MRDEKRRWTIDAAAELSATLSLPLYNAGWVVALSGDVVYRGSGSEIEIILVSRRPDVVMGTAIARCIEIVQPSTTMAINAATHVLTRDGRRIIVKLARFL